MVHDSGRCPPLASAPMNLPFAHPWSKLSGLDAPHAARGPLNKLRSLWHRADTSPDHPVSRPAVPARKGSADTLKSSALYRLKRDSLVIVAKMNEGRGAPSLDAFKRQVVFVQSQLVLAAIRDPDLPVETKAALVGFQEASIRESIEDRRGVKRRACTHLAEHRPDPAAA